MHKKPPTHNAAGPAPPPEDIRLITQAIIDLHIARRTLLIYPLSHEQVKRSIVRSFKSLTAVIKLNSKLTLAVMKDSIGVGQQVLKAKGPALMDLAGVLKHYEIATLTFKKGLEINELARFLQLISADRGEVMAKGGIVAAARERKLSAVEIQTMDYSKLQVTEEQEIRRSSNEARKQGSIWQQFVANIMDGQSEHHQLANPHIDPGGLAALLNQQALDIHQVVDQFQMVFTGTTTSREHRKSLAAELLSFKQMIQELHLELKDQFLSATFDNYGQAASAADTAQLIDGLGGDLIVQMLRQASAAGKKISPSLLAFVKKMGLPGAPVATSPGPGASAGHTQGFSAQNVASLLDREQYETYVDDEYGALLENLTQAARPADMQDRKRFLAQEISAELTDAKVNIHVGRAVTRLMARSPDASAYRDWGRQLTFLLSDLLEGRAYEYLTQVMEFLRSEKKGADEQRAKIAGLVLDQFSDPQFVAKAIETADASMTAADPQALIFFMELGEPLVVEIFDGLEPQETFDEQGTLVQILRNLASLTAREAIERLKDPRPEYVRRMLRIIRKMGDREGVQQIKSLLEHVDLEVRMEALAALLAHQNKWGEVRLRELLGDVQGEAFERAALLAGQYKVRSAVPQLEAVVEQRGRPELRGAAIRALGQIGDPRAIPVLAGIARRRWSMSKKQTQHLKRVVFESLGGYPRDAILDLLRFGVKQKDEAIQSVCKRLLREGSNASNPADEIPKVFEALPPGSRPGGFGDADKMDGKTE